MCGGVSTRRSKVGNKKHFFQKGVFCFVIVSILQIVISIKIKSTKYFFVAIIFLHIVRTNSKIYFFKIKKLSTYFFKKLLCMCVMCEIIIIQVVITRSTHINLWSIITVIIRKIFFTFMAAKKKSAKKSSKKSAKKSSKKASKKKKR